MVSVLDFVPTISLAVVAGAFIISILQFSTLRKNMHMQTEQDIYSRIIEARVRLQNNDAFTRMAKDSPVFTEYFAQVGNPDEYYIAAAWLDLFEFLFHLNQRKMIDVHLWPRWKAIAEALMTIPKFKNVWEKTKQVHTREFIDFIDSL